MNVPKYRIIQIIVTEELKNKIDSAADKAGLSSSSYSRMAVLEYMKK